MANKTLAYGDLRITLTSAYDWRWDDTGSGAAKNGAFWHPQSQGAGGAMRPLGSLAASHHADRNNQWAALLVGDNPAQRRPGQSAPAVAAPVDYTGLWNDAGSGARSDSSFWRPVPPRGYIALGDVACAGHGKPGVEQVWCVRADLVSDGAYGEAAVWDDEGSGAAADGSFWAVLPRATNAASEYVPVPAGTFRFSAGYGKPDGSLAKVPALYVPRVQKVAAPRPPEITEDGIPEVGETFGQEAQSAVTLPFTSFFDAGDRGGLDNIADPFCTVTKQVGWVVLEKFPNYQATSYTQTQTVTTGIKKTKTEETTNSTGVEISSEVGYGLSKWSVSLNYQFSFSQTSSIEEVQERTMSKTITVAPHTVAIAWGKRVVIQGVRSDGSRIEGEVSFNASEEVAVTDVPVKA
ncbi:hypothetical protein C8A01DRAFT_14838 [Parachaetomium inaequale]|uniref:Insecticidal crystal toxin domain-containing protein n=1 Tax=Parachaetomium inaequale TaxID=2588326 RepID=A0AAN6STD0_9PEZI|nr:hypothetical protein C8A01DRAFT_14838 [Parachaetomium inaequale]